MSRNIKARWIAATCNLCGADVYNDEDHRCQIARHRAELLRLREALGCAGAFVDGLERGAADLPPEVKAYTARIISGLRAIDGFPGPDPKTARLRDRARAASPEREGGE